MMAEVTRNANPISVRAAVKSDVSSILNMIKLLAAFEKEPESVKATEESLEATIAFEDTPVSERTERHVARAYVAVAPTDDQKEDIVGMAVYFYNYSTWTSVPGIYLEDLFVMPTYRRRGVASLLLSQLARRTMEVSEGKGRLEWVCLKWNKDALGFYDLLGSKRMDDWLGIRLDGDKLKELAAKQ